MEFTETSHLVADARKLGLDDRAIRDLDGRLDGRPEVPAVAPKHGRCLRTSLEAPKTILEAGKSCRVVESTRSAGASESSSKSPKLLPIRSRNPLQSVPGRF